MQPEWEFKMENIKLYYCINMFIYNSGNEFATMKVINEDYSEALIHFAPTIEDQKKMAKQLNKEKSNSNENDGISGQFVVEYDVERDPTGGEVLVSNSFSLIGYYYNHYFFFASFSVFSLDFLSFASTYFLS